MNNVLTINNLNLDVAKNICNEISDLTMRNKAVANAFAAKFAANYFSNINIDVDSGLHNIPLLLGKYDLADIYIEGLRIEVRLHIEGEPLIVPRIHFDAGILPFAYMFIKVDTELTNGELTGFVIPERINFSTEFDYCKVDNSELLTLENILASISKNDSEVIDNNEDIILKLYDFTDGILNEQETDLLIKQLLISKATRHKLIDIVRTQAIFNYISSDNKESFSNKEVVDNNIDTQCLTIEDLIISDEIEKNDLYNQNFNRTTDTDHLNNHNNKEIDEIKDLFDVTSEDVNSVESFAISNNKKKNSFLVPIFLLLILGGVSYFAYTKYAVEEPVVAKKDTMINNTNRLGKSVEPIKAKPVDMPLETVENIKANVSVEQGTSISVPLIEQNLGASIDVSNLSVNWDVPSGYTSNTVVQRYLIKIGKIIQLNLKAELLLSNKSPISNKISLELEFDAKTNKFKVNNILSSSGEKLVDDLIVNTINRTLAIEQKVNMKVFESLIGNPILIIRL